MYLVNCTDFIEMEEDNVDIIIKLGGSAITHKDELEHPKLETIRRAIEFVSESRRGNRRCIVVHGAGSFGHHHAKQYKVNQGYLGLTDGEQADVKTGFCKTRQSVTKLNHLVTDEFISAGLPAVALSPCGSWVTEMGRVVRSGVDAVRGVLWAGLIPILHGDCVVDTKQGCRILSGDTIIQELSATFHPTEVVFLSDVMGIYDRPPEQQGAKLLPEVHVHPDGNIDIPVITSVHKHDVTGGIQLKLMSAIEVVCRSRGATRVYVCGVCEAARNVCVHGELRGEPGTLIQYQPASTHPT